MYQVLARKWRPQSFEDVIGQDHVVQTLQNALKSEKVGHAYLFSGPRGSGKTTVARLLAKSLNCEKGPTATPCNSCPSCMEIAQSRSLDVIEIDAASRGRVEEMRDLIEDARYAPARDRYKIFIIDEVHMVTTHAFNALLKTLEEPPPFIVFIMATTEKKKVIPTIISRCQQFDFRKIAAESVVKQIAQIAEAEQVTISPEGINTIVAFCDGSMRDALSTLDKLISFCGKDIGDEQIKTVLGFADREMIEGFIRGIAESDPEKVLKLIAAMIEQGQDVMIFYYELLTYFRNLILVKAVKNVNEMTFIPEDELRKLQDLSQPFSLDDLQRIFQLLIDVEEKLKRSVYPRYIFEATAVKLASLAHLEPIEELLSLLSAGTAIDSGKHALREASQQSQAEATPQGREISQDREITETDIPGAGEERFAITSITPFKKIEEPLQREVKPADIAHVIMEKAKQEKPFLNILLSNAQLKIEGSSLHISFTELPALFRERLEERDTISLIEKIASEVYGDKLKVRIVAPPKESQLPGQQPEAKDQTKRRLLFKEVAKEPLVQRFIDQFNATITDIKELKLLREVDDGKHK